MLMQIPSISAITAKAIILKYKSIVTLIDAMKEDINCLNDTTYNDVNGKERKISKSSIDNIKNYLIKYEFKELEELQREKEQMKLENQDGMDGKIFIDK